MVNALINGIFKVIITLANTVAQPFILGVTVLFPDVALYLGHITNYLSSMVQYVPLILDLSLIPRGAFVLFFDYLIIKYSIHLVQQAFSFGIKVYNYFKP